LHLGRRTTARASPSSRGNGLAGPSVGLIGRELPRGEFPAWFEPTIDVGPGARTGSLILCVYSGIAKWAGQVELNSARAHAWHDHELELVALGYDIVALSAHSLEDQRAWTENERLVCTVLSDGELRLAATLGLPTIEVPDGCVYDDLTLVAQEGEVTHVFYPLRDPARDAQIVTSWLGEVHGA
jgi:hypothetical protein